MKEFIDWRLFLISLAIGLLFIYVIKTPMKDIYVFPTPENVDKIQYVDHVDNCFEFNPVETACEDKTENYTIQ